VAEEEANAEGPADGGLTVSYEVPAEVADEQFIRDIVSRDWPREDLWAMHVDEMYSVNCWA
jgi:hypothetical protein